METHEFLMAARLRTDVLETWLEAGWLDPHASGERFSEVDVARAQLIHDLQRMGVNEEGIPVILDLIDQLHGLRRTMRELLSTIHAQPDATRRRIAANIREAVMGRSGGTLAARRPRGANRPHVGPERSERKRT